jgi:5-methylthioadenosine/S-adenosylhomocysteine deaminase
MLDILVKCSGAVTMDSSRRILPVCSIGIEGNRIAYIGTKDLKQAKRIIQGKNLIALPGLINCHTHVYQAIIEGIGYDMHYHPWNIRYLLPIVTHIRPVHARASAQIAALEMIKTGTTTFSDHWYLHSDFSNIEEVSKVFSASGLRSHMVFGFLDQGFGGQQDEGADTSMIHSGEMLLAKARSYIERWKTKDRFSVAIGPGSTEDVSRELLTKIVELAEEMNVSPVIHAASLMESVSKSILKHGMRDVVYLDSLAFTKEKAIVIHAVWLSQKEMDLIAATHTKVVHCPVGNMHLAYGVASVEQMTSRGITVGLGTDGAASYTYDMFEIGKAASMLQKAKNFDSEAGSAEKSLEMLTIDGAKVLGLEKTTGSLEEGKRADIILVDFEQPHLINSFNIVPKLVYSARGSDVVTSIIDGNVVMENRMVVTMDEQECLSFAKIQQQDLAEKGGAQVQQLLKPFWPRLEAARRV